MPKKLLIVFIALIIICIVVLPVLYLVIGSKDIHARIKDKIYTEYRISADTRWFAKLSASYGVSEKTVSEELDLFALYKNKIDPREKKAIEDKALNDAIIITKALEDGAVDEARFNRYIWHIIKNGIIEYYVRSRYHAENKDANALTVTDAEVTAFYQAHKNVYTELKMSQAQAHALIKGILMNQKRDAEYGRFKNKLINTYKLDHDIKTEKR